MKEIRIKYIRDIKPLEIISHGDWIDLRSAVDITLDVGEYKLIPLGVAIELPTGYEALVVPRSSTFAKWGIMQSNSIGVIDESYRGDNDEWHMPVIALRHTHIHKNDRICQFRIIEHQPQITLKDCDTFGNEDRGGIGSTGTN